MYQENLCKYAISLNGKYICDLDGKKCAFIKPIAGQCLAPAQHKFNENPEKSIHEYCNGTFISD